MAGAEELGTNAPFFIPKFHQAAFVQDEDEILKYFLGLLMENERNEQHDMLAELLDLFDADTCPVRYLPYMAYTIGVRLRGDYDEVSQREQIKAAIRWYKEKGRPFSFEILSKSMGFEAKIFELWTNGTDCERAEDLWGEGFSDGTDIPVDADLVDSWKPHSRIDIVTEDINLETVDFDLLLAYMHDILPKLEEVRPIHVLLRSMLMSFMFTDVSPHPVDQLHATVNAHFAEWFWDMQCLHYFYYERADVTYDGQTIDGHSNWLRKPRWYGYETPFFNPMEGLDQLYDRPLSDTGGLVYFDTNHSYLYDCMELADEDLNFELLDVEFETVPDDAYVFYDGRIPHFDGSTDFQNWFLDDDLQIHIFLNGVFQETRNEGLDRPLNEGWDF